MRRMRMQASFILCLVLTGCNAFVDLMPAMRIASEIVEDVVEDAIDEITEDGALH